MDRSSEFFSADTHSISMLCDSLDTGDLVLFSRPCKRMGLAGFAICSCTKLFHSTEWDHIGVVVKTEKGEVEMWEAAFDGVRHYNLEERLIKSKANKISVRRLYCSRDENLRRAANQFVNEIESRPYKSSSLQLIRAAINIYPAKQRRHELHSFIRSTEENIQFIESELKLKYLFPTQRKLLERELHKVKSYASKLQVELLKSDRTIMENSQDYSSLFCSELVAELYQRIGVFDATFPSSNEYLPCDFAPGHKFSRLKFRRGASLGPEICIRNSNIKVSPVMVLNLNEKVKTTAEKCQTLDDSSFKFIESLLRNHPLFMYLDVKVKGEVKKRFSLNVFSNGEIISKPGNSLVYLPLLVDGLVRTYSTTTKLPYVTSVPGSCISDSAVSYNIGKNDVTQICSSSQCKLLQIHVDSIGHVGSPLLKDIFDKYASKDGGKLGKKQMTHKEFLMFTHQPLTESNLMISLVDPHCKGSISLKQLAHVDLLLQYRSPQVHAAFEFAGFNIGIHRIPWQAYKSMENFALRYSESKLPLEDFIQSACNVVKAEEISINVGSLTPKTEFEKQLFGSKSENSCSYEDFLIAVGHSDVCPPYLHKYLNDLKASIDRFRENWMCPLEVTSVDSSDSHDSEAIAWEKIAIVSVCGALGRTLVAPLERLKIIMQTQSSNKGFDSIFHGLQTLSKSNRSYVSKIRSFWHGNSINIARIVPVLVIQTCLYHYLLRPQSAIWRIYFPPKPPGEIKQQIYSELPPYYAGKGTLFELKHLLAGGVAGAFANIITTPIEKVRGLYSANQNGENLSTVFKRALKSSSIFRGVTPTALWSFWYLGISYTSMAILSPFYTDMPTFSNTSANVSANNALNMGLKCGLISGLLGQSAAYPYDLLRRKMQVSYDFQNLSTISSARKIWQAEGIRGFYRGFTPMIIKFVPSFCCSYGCGVVLIKYFHIN